MRTHTFACFALLATTPFLGSIASAQPAPAPAPVVPVAPAAPAPAAEGPAPEATPPAEPTSPEASAPAAVGDAAVAPAIPEAGITLHAEGAPTPALEATPAAVILPEPPAEGPAADSTWFDSAEYRVFVDSYYGMNWHAPKPQFGPQAEVRAYDQVNGFALSWAGADLSLPAAPVGGMLSLRFGPSAERYSGCGSTQVPCDSAIGLSNVKQAFAAYSPVKGLTLDFGKFDTIYGAEVADSQDNMNYTRGVLYWLGQPLFHTGFRLDYEATKELSATLLIVNGWNNSVDNNVGKTFGVQAKYASRNEKLSLALGYLGGPEHDDTDILVCEAGSSFDASVGCKPSAGAPASVNPVDRADSDTKGWRHFVDLVVGLNPTKKLAILANASLGIDNDRDPERTSTFKSATWWGAMLGARYDLGEFGIGGRGEYFDDSDAFAIPRALGTSLITGTLTFDADLGPNVLLKLDNRLDWADRKIFQSGIRAAEGSQITSTLGLVATIP